MRSRSNLKRFWDFSIQSCTSVVKSHTCTSERGFCGCYWPCIRFRFPDPRQIFLLGNITIAGGGHHWPCGRLRMVVYLDGNMGEGRLGGRGLQSERDQHVGLRGIKTRSGAQDLDVTLLALLHHLRLQLLRHLVKRADRKKTRNVPCDLLQNSSIKKHK